MSSAEQRFSIFTSREGDAESGGEMEAAERGGLAGEKFDELEMLRSRIDEQSKLICFLKRRADDQLKENKTLSERFEDLAIAKEEGDEDLKMLRDHVQMVESRFDELADNHEEMIKIKDEYKARCKELTKENKLLQEQGDARAGERASEVQSLRLKLEDTSLEYNRVRDEHACALVRFQNRERELLEDKQKLMKELEASKIQAARAKEDLSSASTSHQSTLSKESQKLISLSREKEDLLREIVNRGRLVQDKQATIDTLQLQLNEKRNEMVRIKEEFAQKEHSLSVNRRVSAIAKEKEELVEKYHSLKTEYNALKEHSNRLLAKEKDLNMLLSCGRSRRSNRNIALLTSQQQQQPQKN